MKNSPKHHQSHELKEGQEVRLGFDFESSKAPDSEPQLSANYYNSSRQGEKKIQPSTQAHQHHQSQSKQHASPKIDLNPRPGSRVSPFRPTPKRKTIRESIKAIRSHRHWHNAKLVAGTVLAFLLIFNSQWFISQFMYLFNSPKPVEIQQKTPVVQSEKKVDEVIEQAEVVGPNNEIIIPKIGVTAPLIFTSTTDEARVLVALRDGVVHYYGTALPGENGNAAFFGHSSNDWWEPGNYKFIFVLLEKLAVGDTYEIHYNSKKYVYRVTETKVVEPNDLSVLNQTATPTSTLITCTPPGTSLRRFVVRAEQIAPKPAPQQTAKVATIDTPKTQVLPSAPPSIWSQVQDFFAGIAGKRKQEENATPAPQQPARLPDIKNL